MGFRLSRLQSPDFPPVQWLAFLKGLPAIIASLVQNPSDENRKLSQAILKAKAGYTMVSVPRLHNLYQRVREANDRNIAGDIVECGCWHGGSAAVMASANLVTGTERTSWLFDSFEGLPQPGENDGQYEHDFFYDGWCKGHTDKVREIFQKVGIPAQNLKIVPGWFEDTLPHVPIERIAVLHVDADWYDSVKLVLETFYERVSPGGFVVIDDYYVWPGCKQAVDEFLKTQNIEPALLQSVNNLAVYFQKPL